MEKRINVANGQSAIRTTVTRAIMYVQAEHTQGTHYIPKKKLKALVKEQKKRNEQTRIAHERKVVEQRRLAAKKQAYENMQTLKAQSSPEPLGPKDM